RWAVWEQCWYASPQRREPGVNFLERTVRRVDGFQQRHPPAAFAYGVVKKFGDDNAGVLVNNLAHSGFVSLFPLLLVLVTIAEIMLGHHPALRDSLLHTAFLEIPIVGPDLKNNVHRLQRGSPLALATALSMGLYFAVFRILTPPAVPTRRLWPGAVAGGVAWSILQNIGTYLIGRNLRLGSEVYGMFAIVLGVVAWVYLLSEITVYAAEVNVVLAHRLWPRSLVQPPLTAADRQALAMQATQNIRRPEEDVDVSFA